jgi:hypothetical protein
LEDIAIVLEHLEVELFGDHGGDHIHEAGMPHPSTSRFLDSRVFPLSSHHPVLLDFGMHLDSVHTHLRSGLGSEQYT